MIDNRFEHTKSNTPVPPSAQPVDPAIFKEFKFTQEEVFSQLGQEPTLGQLITELEQRIEKRP